MNNNDNNASYTPVKTSWSLSDQQSWTLVIVYVMLTAAALSVIVFLLLQLDVILCRRPAVSLRSVKSRLAACCCRRRRSVRPACDADRTTQHRGGRLSMFTPLMVYVGLVDAFVSCDFTEVFFQFACPLKLKFYGTVFHVASSCQNKSCVSGDFPVQLATRLPDLSAGGLLRCTAARLSVCRRRSPESTSTTRTTCGHPHEDVTRTLRGKLLRGI